MYRGWRVVGGAGIGIGFGSAVFVSAAFPLLAAAICRTTGWTQADVARGASVALLMQAGGYAAAGWLIDRRGSRTVASASVALFALSLAALALSGGSYARFLIACGAIGLLAAGTNVLGYARAIARWFDRRRGLALGVAAGCQALGAVLLPLAVHAIVARFGWSAAIAAIAAFEIVAVLPLVLWLVEDAPAGGAAGREIATAPAGTAPASLATFARLALAFAAMGFSFYAVVANIAFILEKAGLGPGEIATFQSVSGLSVLVGRIGFGRLLDRARAQIVGLLTLAAAAAFALTLANASLLPVALAAAALAGLSIGGESDLLPFLASRYWAGEGMARTLGLFLVAFVLGAALGPITFAHASAAFGGPAPALYALAALQILPALLFVTLPAYPRPA